MAEMLLVLELDWAQRVFQSSTFVIRESFPYFDLENILMVRSEHGNHHAGQPTGQFGVGNTHDTNYQSGTTGISHNHPNTGGNLDRGVGTTGQSSHHGRDAALGAGAGLGAAGLANQYVEILLHISSEYLHFTVNMINTILSEVAALAAIQQLLEPPQPLLLVMDIMTIVILRHRMWINLQPTMVEMLPSVRGLASVRQVLPNSKSFCSHFEYLY